MSRSFVSHSSFFWTRSDGNLSEDSCLVTEHIPADQTQQAYEHIETSSTESQRTIESSTKLRTQAFKRSRKELHEFVMQRLKRSVQHDSSRPSNHL